MIFTARIRRMFVSPHFDQGERYPVPGLDGGGGGEPHPSSRWGGEGYPIQLSMGIPHPRSGQGVPHPSQDWMGYPHLGWVPPPARTGWGTPPPGQDWMGLPFPPYTEQHSHLLHGGWYASCVHAGGLSCF